MYVTLYTYEHNFQLYSE